MQEAIVAKIVEKRVTQNLKLFIADSNLKRISS
jgi:hypothetical protein